MRAIGFSTGAISLGNFEHALALLESHSTNAIELSALRISEILPLIAAIPSLQLSRYEHISLHVPSSFSIEEESALIELLAQVPERWTLIVHPDSIHDFNRWRSLASRVAIENMDRRKAIGRTAEELASCFLNLPEAKFCFDIGHARQFDPSMAEAYMILTRFSERLVQVHVSEVDAQSRHAVVTYAAELAFREIAHLIPDSVPLIVESRVSSDQIESELVKVADVFGGSFDFLGRDQEIIAQ